MQEETQNDLAKKHEGILQEARKRFELAQDGDRDNRALGLNDLRILFESSWTPEEIAARQNEFQNRPCLSFPKLNKLIQKTANQIRLNNPGPKISPEGDGSDEETAIKISGLLRQILKNSESDTKIAQAAENQMENSFGYIRITTQRDGDESFDQTIGMDYIQNPFSVYVDPGSKSVVGTDIEWFFISDDIPRTEFKAEWPKATASSFTSQASGDQENAWINEDTIRLVEYYRLVKDPDTLIEGVDKDDKKFKGLKSELEDIDFDDPRTVITRQIPTVKRRWEWFKLTWTDVLESADIASKRCLLIPVYGRIRIVDNKKRLFSLGRPAQDAQKMYDYWQSSAAERLGQSLKTTYIGYKGQFKSDARWEDANINPAPYLEADPIMIGTTPAPLPKPTQAPEPPIGYMAAASAAGQDIKEIMGIDDGLVNQTTGPNSSALQANVLSGKALDILNQNGELATYDFIDNVHKSVRQAFKVIIDMIPNYYTEERTEKILSEDGTEETVVFNGDSKSNKDGKIYNLTTGKYDVDIDVGPDFATQQEEAATETMEFAKAFPNKADAVADIVASTLSNKYSDKMQRRIMKTMDPALLDSDEKQDEDELQVMLSNKTQELETVTEQLNQAIELIQSETLETKRVEMKEAGSTEREVIKGIAALKKQEVASEGEIKEETIQAQAQLLDSLITSMGGPEGIKQFVKSKSTLITQGQEMDGFVFHGGDPSSKVNWSPVNGQ